MALRRLQYERKRYAKNALPGTSVGPVNDDLFEWQAFISDPVGTPYEGDLFEVKLNFSTEYPFKPPKLKFVTRIFHPNISQRTGEVCVDILQKEWSPAIMVDSLPLSASSLLAQPNARDSLNAEASELFLNSRRKYEERARVVTNQFAT